jgi:hypothetical protein
LANGTVVYVGDFVTYNGITVKRVVGITPAGLTSSMNPNTGIGSNGRSNFVASSDKDNSFVFSPTAPVTYNGTSVSTPIKINYDGTINTTWQSNIGTGLVGGSQMGRYDRNSNSYYFATIGSATFNGSNARGIMKLSEDGIFDTTFATNISNGITGNSSYGVNIIDDKIWLLGEFTQWNGVASNGAVILNMDGTVHHRFTSGAGGFSGFQSPRKVVKTNSGNYIVVGGFTSWDGDNVPGGTTNGIVLLDSSYNVVSSFYTNLGSITGTLVVSMVYDASVLPDGRIIIAGGFTTINSVSRSGMAIIDENGNLDTTFNPGTGFNERVLSFTYDNSGITAVGAFTSYNGGSTIGRIAKISLTGQFIA